MSRPEPSTEPSVDLKRYAGTWFEVARLPMKHEPEDYTDITATYELQPDGSVRVVNRAYDGQGELQESSGEARLAEAGDNSRLKVTFLPQGLRWIPFTEGDYWILRVDDDYRTALVGTPDYQYLWLLNREPVIDDGTRDSYLDTARALGYDLDTLIHTPHTGRGTA